MSHIDDLIAQHCPNGVPRRRLSTLGIRNKGTAMTASKMKSIGGGGPVRIFAGGNTVADVSMDAIPEKDIVKSPSIIVKSRGNIGFEYYEKLFSHKSELWSYTISDYRVEQKFVYYYLLTKVDSLQALARATSVKIPQLSVKDTDSLQIPVPPLEVQRGIVRILDQFTALEAELEAELEARRRQYGHYRDALFDDINHERWVPLSQIGRFQRGSSLQKKNLTDAGVPAFHYGQVYTHYGVSAVTTKSFVSQEFSLNKRCLNPGDVFIATTSENEEDLGKAVAWLGDEPAVASSDAYIYRSDADARFISHFFASEHFQLQKKKFVTGTKVKRLSGDSIGKIRIPFPSRSEQEIIADSLDRFETLVNDLSVGLPAELAARRKQYEYYRDKLLTFEEAPA